MSKTFRTLVSAAAAVAVMGSLLPAAVAADKESPVIDTSATGSVVIHKRDGQPSANHATGKQDASFEAGTKPLEGAKFKIERVKKADGTQYDFAKAADLAEAIALKPSTIASDRLEQVLEPTATDAQGMLTKGDLPVGVYLVTETEAPAGYVKGAPFLVYLPTSDNAAGTAQKWIYDVHVYPKNTTTPVEKKVNDANQHQDGTITYTVETGVIKPRPESTGDIVKYEVKDTIETAHASVRFANAAAVKEVKIGANTVLTTDEYDVVLSPNGKVVEIKLKGTGLQKLTTAVKADSSVKVFSTLEMVVGADFNLAQGILNRADLKTNPNNNQEDEDTTIPGNRVETYYGKLKIVKKGDKNNALLEGAKFKVFECNADGTTANEAKPVFNQEFTTGANGEVVFPVMHVTDIVNSAVTPDVIKYCVKETEAPAGYALPANPVTPIDFKKGDLTVVGAQAESQTLELTKTITNEKRITPELPLTGGAGIALFVLGGAGLIGAGTYAARRNSKKNA